LISSENAENKLDWNADEDYDMDNDLAFGSKPLYVNGFHIKEFRVYDSELFATFNRLRNGFYLTTEQECRRE
jgi:hypothetical protein